MLYFSSHSLIGGNFVFISNSLFKAEIFSSKEKIRAQDTCILRFWCLSFRCTLRISLSKSKLTFAFPMKHCYCDLTAQSTEDAGQHHLRPSSPLNVSSAPSPGLRPYEMLLSSRLTIALHFFRTCCSS